MLGHLHLSGTSDSHRFSRKPLTYCPIQKLVFSLYCDWTQLINEWGFAILKKTGITWRKHLQLLNRTITWMNNNADQKNMKTSGEGIKPTCVSWCAHTQILISCKFTLDRLCFCVLSTDKWGFFWSIKDWYNYRPV